MRRLSVAWLALLFAVFVPLQQPAARTAVDTPTWVEFHELPPQAAETWALIRKGGPFPYTRDGTTFFNRERLLPERSRGHYREYTVPTPGASNRGARRIVTGGDPRVSDEVWYTDDHYRSFRRIRLPQGQGGPRR
jgi:ribonuclease T1